MDSKKHIYALAVSIALLAGSFVYVALILSRLNDHASPLIEQLTLLCRAVPVMTDEVVKLQAAVPPVVEQVERIRTELPAHLDRVEYLISTAERAGERAGRGAVKGVVKGTVTAPLSLLSVFGGWLNGSVDLSDVEQDSMAKAVESLLRSDQPGQAVSFACEGTGLEGKATLLGVYVAKNSRQYRVQIEAHRKRKEILSRILLIERSPGGTMKLVKTT